MAKSSQNTVDSEDEVTQGVQGGNPEVAPEPEPLPSEERVYRMRLGALSDTERPRFAAQCLSSGVVYKETPQEHMIELRVPANVATPNFIADLNLNAVEA